MAKISDETIKEFLETSYFGNFDGQKPDNVHLAVYRAYRDFNRTLTLGKSTSDNERLELKNKVAELFKNNLLKKLSSVATQDGFDKIHKENCDEIKKIYDAKNITITYGQAQKWVNMFLKYYYILEAKDIESKIEFFHVPIDSIIINLVKSKFSISGFPVAWSKLDDYDAYIKYQNDLRTKIIEENNFPLKWEFENWNQN